MYSFEYIDQFNQKIQELTKEHETKVGYLFFLQSDLKDPNSPNWKLAFERAITITSELTRIQREIEKVISDRNDRLEKDTINCLGELDHYVEEQNYARAFERAEDLQEIKGFVNDLRLRQVIEDKSRFLHRRKEESESLLSCAANFLEEGNYPSCARYIEKALVCFPNHEWGLHLSNLLCEKYVSDRKKRLEKTAYAIARIRSNKEEKYFIGKSFYIEAGISIDDIDDFSNSILNFKIGDKEKYIFDITIRGDAFRFRHWQKVLEFYPSKPGPQLVHFIFQPTIEGQHNILLDFYHERHWLQTLQLPIEVLSEEISVRKSIK